MPLLLICTEKCSDVVKKKTVKEQQVTAQSSPNHFSPALFGRGGWLLLQETLTWSELPRCPVCQDRKEQKRQAENPPALWLLIKQDLNLSEEASYELPPT